MALPVLKFVTPKMPLQRSAVDKVLGRGRRIEMHKYVLAARVPTGQWPAAEWCS
jgi:hypothetical protein